MQTLSLYDKQITVQARPRRIDPAEMQIDAQTLRDLEVFDAEGGAPSLFNLINSTRTLGGEAVLRGRMRTPFCKADRIRAVQDTLQFIIDNRPVFNDIPGEGVVHSVERYMHSGGPPVTTAKPIEGMFEATFARFGDVAQYERIQTGVSRASTLIHSLRRMAFDDRLASPAGELAPIFEEMRTLLARGAFKSFPAEGMVLPYWKVLSIDRELRLGERLNVERLIKLAFDVDALVSMADAVTMYRFVIPQVEEGDLRIDADDVYHPFLPAPVPNPLHINQEHRLLFLTGPNMAGKTTYLRAAATAIYLAHIGMGVNAKSFRFTPCESLFSAISLTDNVREGISFFRAEALRIKAIAMALADGRRVIAVLDEPFMGTNVKDAVDVSREVLTRFAGREQSIFLVSSHLIELGDSLGATRSVACNHFEADESPARLQFDYVLRPGISSQRLGVRVLREEGVFDVLGEEARNGNTPH
jgi:DNA mismatch repair protein MutS